VSTGYALLAIVDTAIILWLIWKALDALFDWMARL
jgi:hypothetical protein